MTGTHSFGPRFAMHLLAATACAMVGSAHAQSEPPPPVAPQSGPAQPFSFGISQTLTHDSNLFRASDHEEEDWTSVTALNFALDQPIGRQRLHGNAALQMNRYSEHDELNNMGHELGLQLDWETIGNISGALGVQSSQHQYRIGLDSATTSGDGVGKNLESVQSAFLQGRLGGMGLWALQAGVNGLERHYSDDNFADRNDLSQWGASGGISYRPTPDLTATLLGKYDRIDRVDGSENLVADDVGRKAIELGVVWQLSGASRIDARVSRAHENHSVADKRDFWAGGIGWDWQPSAKLTFRTQLLRDTEGASGNVATAEPTMPAAPSGDQLRTAFIWTGRWAATSKISMTAVAQWSHRKLGLFAIDVAEPEDRTTAFSLGIRYSPMRALDVGCDISTERRETNTRDFLVTRPYDATTAGCNLQFWFR